MTDFTSTVLPDHNITNPAKEELSSCGDIFMISHLDNIYFIGYGIIMTTLIAFGVVGNIFNLLIFSSPRVWATLNYYLIALALWDLALLTTSFAFWSFWSIYYRGGVRLFGTHVHILKYAYVLGNITLTGCIWVIVTLTVERYMSILFPLRHRTLNNASRAKVIIILVSLAVLVFNAVRPLEVEVAEMRCLQESTAGGVTVIRGEIMQYIKPTLLRTNDIYVLLYRVLGSILFIYLVPCCILAVLTFRMCLALREASKIRKTIAIHKQWTRRSSSFRRPSVLADLLGSRNQSMDSAMSGGGSGGFVDKQTKAETSVNRMLSVVLVKFLLCYTLPTVNDLLECTLPPNVYKQAAFVEILVIWSNILVVLNSSCNFFIYFATGKRFRKECLLILREFSCKSSERSPTSSTTTFVNGESSSFYHLPSAMRPRCESTRPPSSRGSSVRCPGASRHPRDTLSPSHHYHFDKFVPLLVPAAEDPSPPTSGVCSQSVYGTHNGSSMSSASFNGTSGCGSSCALITSSSKSNSAMWHNL